MKSRTCPYCNYKYSISDYRKHILFKLAFSEWACKNCGRKITFDFIRRIIVASAFSALYMFLFSLKHIIIMTPLRWGVIITLFVIGTFYVFTFDSFKKVE